MISVLKSQSQRNCNLPYYDDMTLVSHFDHRIHVATHRRICRGRGNPYSIDVMPAQITDVRRLGLQSSKFVAINVYRHQSPVMLSTGLLYNGATDGHNMQVHAL